MHTHTRGACGASMHTYRCIYIHSHQLFLLIALVGYRPAQGGCSDKEITCVTPVTSSQANACVKGKKGSVIKGATCPALPGCRRASPLPPSQTGGRQVPQCGESSTTFERGLSTGLPPPQGFPSAGSLPPLGCAGRACLSLV